MRRAAPFLIVAALGGCASAPATGPPQYSASLSTPAMPVRALAALPAAAGDVLTVLEQRRSNAVMQQIILRGDAPTFGENKIIVNAITATPTGRDDVRLEQPSDASIEDELAEGFPNIRMTVSLALNHNAYGPFGYALGRSPGAVTCIYAWQWIAGEDKPNLLAGMNAPRSFPVSIRVRLCRAGSSEQALVDLIRQLMVNAPDGDAYPAAAATGPAYASDALASAGYGGAIAGGDGRTPTYNAPPGAHLGTGAASPEPLASPRKPRRHVVTKARLTLPDLPPAGTPSRSPAGQDTIPLPTDIAPQ